MESKPAQPRVPKALEMIAPIVTAPSLGVVNGIVNLLFKQTCLEHLL